MSPIFLTQQSVYKYYRSGFLGFQNALDQSFLWTIDQVQALRLKIGLHQFPFSPYEDDSFWPIIERLLPLFMAISFSYPFCIITKTLVEEKVWRLKEGFRILGGSNAAYLTSFALTYWLMFSLTNVFLTWLLSVWIFTRTHPFILFITIELFGMDMIALAMLISTFFNQPKMSATMAWVLFMFLFFIYRFVETAPHESAKDAVCISGPSAFGLGAIFYICLFIPIFFFFEKIYVLLLICLLAILQISKYEEYQIGIQWSNVSEYNELMYFRLSTALWYMFFDAVVYCLLMLYFDRVLPTEYGVRRPWYAPFEFMDDWSCYQYILQHVCRIQLSNFIFFYFMRIMFVIRVDEKEILDKSQQMHRDIDVASIETVDEKKSGAPILELKDLTKVYSGEHGRTNVAVNHLNLKMYRNQVFCLLGHNGAGKTTTCNMLTGMVPVTHGDAIVEENLLVRQRMGLCPQHDILYPRLTVWEHLQFYGNLNGMKGEELNQLCLELLTKVGLREVNIVYMYIYIYMYMYIYIYVYMCVYLRVCISLPFFTLIAFMLLILLFCDSQKRAFLSMQLSGGQKRKLSVCIALIGRTSIVILDEPTTGMDPYARRATWELIREYRKNRCIILTTHFMDEAEILADRIGIMAHGRLMCCGSPFFLKQRYDVGYALTISLSTNSDSQIVRNLAHEIQHVLKDENCKCIGYAANEVVFRISFENNAMLPTLFRYFDENRDRLNFVKYGISATTLEEVFRMINRTAIFSKEESISKRISSDGSKDSTLQVQETGMKWWKKKKVTGTNTGRYKPVTLPEKTNTDQFQHQQQQQQQQQQRQTNHLEIATDDESNIQEEKSEVSQSGHSGKKTQLDAETLPLPSTGRTTITNIEMGEVSKPSDHVDNDQDGQKRPSTTTNDHSKDTSKDRAATPEPVRRPSFLDGYDAVVKDEILGAHYEENLIDAHNMSNGCTSRLFWLHVGAILQKRYRSAKRDYKTFLCQILIPSIFMLLGLLFIRIDWWQDQPLYYFNTQDFVAKSNEELTIPYNVYDPSAVKSYYQSPSFMEIVDDYDNDAKLRQQWLGYKSTAYQSNISLPQWQDLLLRTRKDNVTARYISFWMNQVIDPSVAIIGANSSAFHGFPTGYNLATTSLTKRLTGDFDANIATASHPFARTASQQQIVDAANAFMTSINFAMGLSFVPAAFIAMLVDERVSMVKHQQLVSGVDIVSYWLGNYIFDFAMSFIPAFFLMLYCVFFQSALFVGEALFPVFLVAIAYGFSITPFTYLMSLVFGSPSTAQGFMILVYWAMSVIAMVAAWVMDIIDDPSLHRTNSKLKIVYRFIPAFCMGDAYRGIATRGVTFLWHEKISVYDERAAGLDLWVMLIEGFGYFGILLAIEWFGNSPAFLNWINSFFALHYKAPYEKKKEEWDEDVLAEYRRLSHQKNRFNRFYPIVSLFVCLFLSCQLNEPKQVQASTTGNEMIPTSRTGEKAFQSEEKHNQEKDENGRDMIELHGLRKVFRGSYSRPPTIAVQDLWFGVKKGEIFGFLGLNGAGKTTTMSILTGVFPPTSGTAYLNGFNVSNQIAVRRSLGYCPQFSALFPRLTVREHLEFYAAIKGIQQHKIPALVIQMIKDLSLEVYENRQAGQLSGGNQRFVLSLLHAKKLSVGIALIGNPPIVLLDEPSSGMDPVSRRGLWDFVSATMSGRSVILTTHSMEECEALCQRIGIMINGHLGCLGTSTHLKTRFGHGYQLDVRFNYDQTSSMYNSHEELLPHSTDGLQVQTDLLCFIDFDEKIGTNMDRVLRELKKALGEAMLLEDHGSVARLQVGTGNESIADVFEHMESLKTSLNVSNYAVSQTSLEQIFVRFAKDQRDEKEREKEMQDFQNNENVAQRLCGCCNSLFVVD
ncbi:ATP-binding cassette superfamily [Reticulomyxa filosa]|uniref:ATP-binding cassette superfamily n=1 Tax=Reticulomyxa filosa TaxID=46433 RepID=X6M4T8_RETFI|nr:ATP-binding cassette superfamily [Reticulomyxa filosa]|eukprot:ETO08909.1 ATP-binding cassette superfamily [Reticulomyxa filosa]